MEHDVTLLYMVSKEVETNINMLGPRVLHWVLSDVNRRRVITKEWNTV